jgi:hypothetical protein
MHSSLLHKAGILVTTDVETTLLHFWTALTLYFNTVARQPVEGLALILQGAVHGGCLLYRAAK